MTEHVDAADTRLIIESLQRMDERISRLESHLGFAAPEDTPADDGAHATQEARRRDALEFRIGQFWAARTGIVLLVVGFAFLLTFPFERAPNSLVVALGFAITAGILGLARIAQRSFAHIARCLLGGGLFLLYFTTLRLHFFASDAVVATRWVEVSLLSVAVVTAFVIAVRVGSVPLAALAASLGCVTVIVSEQVVVCQAGMLVLAMTWVGLSLRLGWYRSLAAVMVMSYFTCAIVLFGNPIMTGQFQLQTSPRLDLLFLLAYCAVFSAASLFRTEQGPAGEAAAEHELLQASLNSMFGYGLYLLSSVAAQSWEAAVWQLPPAGLLLALASVFWVRRRSTYATFVYAMLGYGALTIAIALATEGSRLFLLLCWQSVLVLATSLWFRSKFIVLANFMIYAGVLLSYLVSTGLTGWVGLSFGLVALLSARVLNWQKSRLELRTEFMRNSYLTVAFLILPYTIWCTAPRKWVGLSWLAVAVAYYVLSLVLNNRKYRWMALLTMLLTVLYVLVIGIVQLEPEYRIVSFVAVGAALLVISVIYWSRSRKDDVAIEQE